jgi:hypothetical protein
MTKLASAVAPAMAASPEPVWEQYAHALQQAFVATPDAEQAMAQELRQATHWLYNALVEEPNFRNRFLLCPEREDCDAPTWSQTLYESKSIRAGLLSVYRDTPVPLHDHPGSIGVTLVLSGVAKVEYATIVDSANTQGLATLELIRVRERLPGQVCWFFEHDRNIHGIEAITASALLLVMHLPNIDAEKQNLYFPVNETRPDEGNTFLANRVKLRRGQSQTDHY